jgi:GMP synthase (glutamine-hydrolysing)
VTLPRLLLIKTGSTHPDVARMAGDYDAWFLDALEDGRARCTVVRASEGEKLPRARDFGGILLTGSPSSVRDEAPWMSELARWALEAAESGVPVLGVCFGHQLLGEALGGRVEPNPRGWEGGTVKVQLTPEGRADPLFAGLPDELEVQATHQDELATAPRAVRLAGNDCTTWQAFAAGRMLRAVQFHPELRERTLSALLKARGRERPVRATVHGKRVLHNWDEAFVRGG